MIDPSQLAHLTPARRAEIIYAQARSEVNAKLWQVALGSPDDERRSFTDGPISGFGQGVNFNSLLALLVGKQDEESPGPLEVQEPDTAPVTQAAPTATAERATSP